MSRGKKPQNRRNPAFTRTPVDNVRKADAMRRQFDPISNEGTVRRLLETGLFAGIAVTQLEYALMQKTYLLIAARSGGVVESINGKPWLEGGAAELHKMAIAELLANHPKNFNTEYVPRISTTAPFEGKMLSSYEEKLALAEYYRQVSRGILDPLMTLRDRDVYNLLEEANNYEADRAISTSFAGASEGNELLQASLDDRNPVFQVPDEISHLDKELDPARRAGHAMKTADLYRQSLLRSGRIPQSQVDLVVASAASIFASRTDERILNGIVRESALHLVDLDRTMQDFMAMRNNLEAMGAPKEMIDEAQKKLMTSIWGDEQAEKIVDQIDPSMIKTMRTVNNLSAYSDAYRDKLAADADYDDDELDSMLADWAKVTMGHDDPSIPVRQLPLTEIYEMVKNIPLTDGGRDQLMAILQENGYTNDRNVFAHAWKTLGDMARAKKSNQYIKKVRKLFGEDAKDSKDKDDKATDDDRKS